MFVRIHAYMYIKIHDINILHVISGVEYMLQVCKHNCSIILLPVGTFYSVCYTVSNMHYLPWISCYMVDSTLHIVCYIFHAQSIMTGIMFLYVTKSVCMRVYIYIYYLSREGERSLHIMPRISHIMHYTYFNLTFQLQIAQCIKNYTTCHTCSIANCDVIPEITTHHYMMLYFAVHDNILFYTRM